MKVRRTIDDYAAREQRAFVRIEEGQRAGGDPHVVAETVLRIIHSRAPAGHYLVGSEKWAARLSRVLPASAIESLMTRHFGLSH